MCYFCVTYEDGKYVECSHVTGASYNGYDSTVKVEEANLSTTLFPLKKTLWLHTSDGMYCISGDGVRTIEVHKE